MNFQDFIKNLNESLNPYFNKQTFYKVSKNHFPELKRMIMKFLQQKRVKIIGEYSCHVYSVDFNDLSQEKKQDLEKNIKSGLNAINNHDITEFPRFSYKDFKIKIEIKTNETFFEDGHDLIFKIEKDDELKNFQEKINLIQEVDVVLNKIWSILEEKLNNFSEIVEPKKEQEYREKIPSLIRSTFDYTIGKIVKTKKGETSIVRSDDGSSIEFTMTSIRYNENKMSSVNTPVETSFSIKMKVKTFSPDSAWVQKKYPEIQTAFEKYINKGGSSSKLNYVLDGRNFIGSDHENLMNRFKVFCDRVSKLGYYPKESYYPYSKREPDVIEFYYGGDKLKKNLNSGAPWAKSKIENYINIALKEFYSNYIRVSDIDNFLFNILSDEKHDKVRTKLRREEELSEALDEYVLVKSKKNNRRLIKFVIDS